MPEFVLSRFAPAVGGLLLSESLNRTRAAAPFGSIVKKR